MGVDMLQSSDLQYCCVHVFTYTHTRASPPSLANNQGHEEDADVLFKGLPEEFQMWMSHGDKLHNLPDGSVNGDNT